MPFSLKSFVLSFIPIFVAVDALGILPIYLSLVEGLKKEERLQVLRHSILTAVVISVTFVFAGKGIFLVLGITVPDFMIAGGALLFVLSMVDLLFPKKQRRAPSAGIVPLGMPLIVGPAVLTASLLSLDAYGLGPTLLSLILNISLAGAILYLSHHLMRIMGENGALAFSKVSSLLLAAIAVMLIRKGVMEIIGWMR